jgi:hypothetical protein
MLGAEPNLMFNLIIDREPLIDNAMLGAEPDLATNSGVSVLQLKSQGSK